MVTELDALVADLHEVGLRAGDIVLVHCSLRRVGLARPEGLLDALRAVLTGAGTLVVPTHTAGNSTTSHQFRAETAGMTDAQKAAWEAAIRPFDPARSPSQEMGALAEMVRRHPEAVRSGHPQTSYGALGPEARKLLAVHDLDSHLGERSPQAALYDADAKVLLIGVGYAKCTAFHLGEYRLPTPPRMRAHRCYVRGERGERRRVDFVAPHLDDGDFERLGADFDHLPDVRRGSVGAAPARLFPMRAAVDFAVRWMIGHRRP